MPRACSTSAESFGSRRGQMRLWKDVLGGLAGPSSTGISLLKPRADDLTQPYANLRFQATRRRVLVCSRPVAPSATPSRLAVATRSAPRCTAFSAATLVPLRATHTPMPTSRRALSGRRTLLYVLTMAPVYWRLECALLTEFPPAVRLPREPQEVHSWHQDGLRWPEEGEGQERSDHVGVTQTRLDWRHLPLDHTPSDNIKRRRC